MKAVLINEYGGRDKLMIVDVPKPEAGEGEVVVKIKAAGVNPVDWKIRTGLLKDRLPNQFPIVLGWDMSGVVEARGHGARRFEAGDAVYAYCRRPVIQKGTYAEYISLPECYLSLKPKSLSFEKAAGVPLAGLTAYQAIFDRAQVKKGETVLVVGASGGVGSFAVQFAKIAGAKVFAVAGKSNHAYLKKLGAARTLDYQKEDFQKAFLAAVPKGADVVLAFAGGESLVKAYSCVRKKGRLVTIVEKGDENAARQKGFELLYHFVEPNAKELRQIRKWIDAKKVAVATAAVLPLEQAAKAHELIESAHTRGKIVLKVA